MSLDLWLHGYNVGLCTKGLRVLFPVEGMYLGCRFNLRPHSRCIGCNLLISQNIMNEKENRMTRELFWDSQYTPKRTLGHFPLRNKEFRNHSHSDFGWTFELNLYYHRCSLMQLCCALPFLPSISKICAESMECGGGQEFSVAGVSISHFSSPQQPTLFRGSMGLWSCITHF